MIYRLPKYPLVAAAIFMITSCAPITEIIEAVAESCGRPSVRVTTTADLRQPCTTESCPLWGAINLANTCNSGMVVELENTQYTVRRQVSASPLPPSDTIFTQITGRFTIDGNGAVIAREPGTEDARFFVLRGRGDLTLKDITITGGGYNGRDSRAPIYSGGAVENHAILEIDNASFVANRSRNNGGAIANHGVMIARGGAHIQNETGGGCESGGGGFLKNFPSGNTLIHSATLSQNRGSCGGAILNEGIIHVFDSTFRANMGGADDGDATFNAGGGLYNGSEVSDITVPIANIVRSSFFANTALSGAAILNEGSSSMWLHNSTVSANRTVSPIPDFGEDPRHHAAGIWNGGELTIRDATITDNHCGEDPETCVGGLKNYGRVTIRNSILASNGEPDCWNAVGAPFIAHDANLDGDSSCPGFSLHADPNLGGLRDNGGPTATHAVSGGSPPHDAGGLSCFDADQRGEPRERTEGDPCDLGSFEL